MRSFGKLLNPIEDFELELARVKGHTHCNITVILNV